MFLIFSCVCVSTAQSRSKLISFFSFLLSFKANNIKEIKSKQIFIYKIVFDLKKKKKTSAREKFQI